MENNNKLLDAIENCATLELFMEKHISLYCRYKNGIEALYKLRDKKANEKKIVPFVIWLAGFTECGKTKIAMEIA